MIVVSGATKEGVSGGTSMSQGTAFMELKFIFKHTSRNSNALTFDNNENCLYEISNRTISVYQFVERRAVGTPVVFTNKKQRRDSKKLLVAPQ